MGRGEIGRERERERENIIREKGGMGYIGCTWAGAVVGVVVVALHSDISSVVSIAGLSTGCGCCCCCWGDGCCGCCGCCTCGGSGSTSLVSKGETSIPVAVAASSLDVMELLEDVTVCELVILLELLVGRAPVSRRSFSCKLGGLPKAQQKRNESTLKPRCRRCEWRKPSWEQASGPMRAMSTVFPFWQIYLFRCAYIPRIFIESCKLQRTNLTAHLLWESGATQIRRPSLVELGRAVPFSCMETMLLSNNNKHQCNPA